jgi:hypothetical protein
MVWNTFHLDLIFKMSYIVSLCKVDYPTVYLVVDIVIIVGKKKYCLYLVLFVMVIKTTDSDSDSVINDHLS